MGWMASDPTATIQLRILDAERYAAQNAFRRSATTSVTTFKELRMSFTKTNLLPQALRKLCWDDAFVITVQ